MFRSWRNPSIAALAAALALLPNPALALEPADLEEMETLLRDLGFDPGAVDGVVDDDTIAAIRRYQEFALLPGAPEPSEKLLNELRGVAAAFAALSAVKEEEAPAAPAKTPRTSEPQGAKGGSEEAATEKVIVPPPPPPPKLKPPEAAEAPESEAEATGQPEAAEETEPSDEDAVAAAPPQVAELPQPQAAVPEEPEAPPASEPPAEVAPEEPAVPDEPAAEETTPDPAAEAQARIDAELAPYRRALDSGSLSREELAKRFNQEGREALETARYDEAILKFSVAIHLDPRFAGAYSNRGTTYQHLEETDLAAEDFAKAKQLGFGGFRLRDGRNPFN